MQRKSIYSLWLMPGDELYDILQSTIVQLSKPYRTPVFEPHVTLLGTLPEKQDCIIEKTLKLAGLLQPYTIKLAHIDYLNDFFRCLFIHVEKTHEVVSSYKCAQELFGKQRGDEYMPHLSLMYGDINVSIKKAIKSTLGTNLSRIFLADKIYLYSTTGNPGSWFKVKQFPLR